ncbi:MAG TPA: hypothetical protein VLC79_08455 [Cellvibrio sp.]|nr:hypothetical protein [Cellvibrio sp.]
MFARIISFCLISIVVTGCSSVKDKNNSIAGKSGSMGGESSVVTEITANFSKAVEAKDAAKFKSLFLNDSVSWFAIISEQDASRYKNDPRHKKVNLHEIGHFAEWLVKTKEPTEVKFSDCKTSGDTDVMVADCGYAFYLGGKESNNGREVFILINTESGWKISGIAFSAKTPKKEDM